MATATRPMTADDLLLMPDDGFRYELVRGELRKMSPAGYDHGIYGGRIYASLAVYLAEKDLGEMPTSDTGYLLAEDHVRVPDVSFINRRRAPDVGSEPGYFQGPPDLAVEVISPNDRLTDVAEKIKDYLEAGTLAVVVVNPRNRTVAVHRPSASPVTLTESDVVEIPEVIPGWALPVAGIFN